MHHVRGGTAGAVCKSTNIKATCGTSLNTVKILNLFQATEKIIVSSSKLINRLENLELLKTSVPPATPAPIEMTSEPRPAYEIFGNLENLILYADDDDDFFMPSVDGIW